MLNTVKHERAAAVFGPHPAHALPLWLADMEIPCCEHITRALTRRASVPSFGYTLQPTEMWAAVSAWLYAEHRWSVPADAFVFSPSVVTSVHLVLSIFTEKGDGVLLMTPLYRPLQDAVSLGGRRLLTVQLKGASLELDWYALEAHLRDAKVLLLCNPHNPGGRLWSASELRRLTSACARHSVLLISDEIWADWALGGGQYTPAALANGTSDHQNTSGCEEDRHGGCRLVTLGAPTKTWNLAGLHASYLIFSSGVDRRRYLDGVSHAFLSYGSTFATEVILAAYTLGSPWLRGAKALVEKNLDTLEVALAALGGAALGGAALGGAAEGRGGGETTLVEGGSPLPGEPIRGGPLRGGPIRFTRPRATYLAWLDCTALGFSDGSALNAWMRDEAALLLSAGGDFGEHTAQWQRLNCAVPSDVMDEVVKRLSAAVKARQAKMIR